MATKTGRKALPNGRSAASGKYVALPNNVLDSAEWAALSPFAVKLLLEIYRKFNGRNNGNLSFTKNESRARGWSSPSTLYKAHRELIEAGFLIVTRQGGKNVCSLYAVTFQAIDPYLNNNGASQYDAGIKPTPTPPATWKKNLGT